MNEFIKRSVMKTDLNHLGGMLIRLPLAAVMFFIFLLGAVISLPVHLVDYMFHHGQHHM